MGNEEYAKLIDSDKCKIGTKCGATISRISGKYLQIMEFHLNELEETFKEEKIEEQSNLTLSEEDSLKTQIYSCWSIPLGIPLDADIIVRVKLEFSDDGFVNNATFINTRVNERWTRHIFLALASSADRAIIMCQPRNGYFETAPKHLWLNLNWRKATK